MSRENTPRRVPPRARSPREVAQAISAAAASHVRGALEGLISGFHPMDIAYAMRELDEKQRRTVFEVLEAPDAAVVLEEVDPEIEAELVEQTQDPKLAQIIDAMPPDSGADVVAAMEKAQAQKVLDLIPDEESQELEELLEYAEDTAGGRMTTEFVAVPHTFTCGQAIEHIRAQGDAAESLYYLYVVDDADELIGVADLRRLVAAAPQTPILDVCADHVISVTPEVDQEEVARLVNKYDLAAIPVVDHDSHLLGVVTFDDVIDVIHEEHSEDLSHIAGTQAEELLSGSPLRAAGLRLPWLVFCVTGSLLAGAIIAVFRGRPDFALLMIFLPVIMGTAGNSGLQSSTLVVRSLALGLFEAGGYRGPLRRMVLVGMLMGLVAGLVVGVIALFALHQPPVALAVATAMFIAITWAAVWGACVPLILNRLGADPAISAGPLISSLNDSFAVAIYFAVAILLFHILGR